MTDTRKQTYTLSSRSGLRKFYDFATCVGYQEDGRGVWAWRDGLWVLEEHTGASTWWIANRVSVLSIHTPIDTREALAGLSAVIQEVA